MEEEKKKRWRPSVAEYRRLEKENEELRKGNTSNVTKVLRDHIEALESENTSLKRSNELMEKELRKTQEKVFSFEAQYLEQREMVFFLENRGLWARIINRKYQP